MVPHAAVSEGPGGYVDLPDPAHQSASLQEIRANDMPREELDGNCHATLRSVIITGICGARTMPGTLC